MLKKLKILFSIDELRSRIFFTILLLVLCRLGSYIPVPGINGALAVQMFQQAIGGTQNLFQLMDVFSGGAFAQMTIMALGVMPYISASIIIQLLVALLPTLQKEMKENPELGRRKMGKWTRLGTICLACFQSLLFGKYIMSLHNGSSGIIVSDLLSTTFFGIPWLFYLILMVTMTTGTMLLMWVGEQITEYGIGNGVSLIITVGILSSLPTTLGSIVAKMNLDSQVSGQISFFSLCVLLSLFILIIVGTILVIQAQRRIPIQYARKMVGNRRESSGGNSYIPLKVNYAGVIPVIFASSLLMFPATIGQFFGVDTWLGQITQFILPGTLVYGVCFVLLIIFFTYFWTATQFRPEQIAADMKRHGAFIPGIRQGRPTQKYLESTMNYITFAGALILSCIAILPSLVGYLLRVDSSISYFFGGTSLLILVGVVLDTSKQVESYLLMQRYDGFMRWDK